MFIIHRSLFIMPRYFILVFFLVFGLFGCFTQSQTPDASTNNNATTAGNTNDTSKTNSTPFGMSSSDNATTKPGPTNDPIPLKVYQVLQYIRIHHAPMPGYEGGRTFGNFQGVLPKTDAAGKQIVYQEWDVNKHVQGVNRGVERLCTGSDGRAWYTHDHYVTFAQVFDKKVPATSDESSTTANNSEATTPLNTNDKIAKVVAYIFANDAPMPGYEGGSVFENREKLLPETDASGKAITYQVWDVNPSTNRGVERIVTGSDDRVWFTPNKFKSFSEVKDNGSETTTTATATPTSDDASAEKSGKTIIPPKVYAVLKYVLANHAPMPGYVGGREFTNFEKVLPYADATGKKIFYQEWDVNKHIQGVNRGAERLCTGADGRNWYTSDHYKTFVQVK